MAGRLSVNERMAILELSAQLLWSDGGKREQLSSGVDRRNTGFIETAFESSTLFHV